jgi:hypothetical protein
MRAQALKLRAVESRNVQRKDDRMTARARGYKKDRRQETGDRMTLETRGGKKFSRITVSSFTTSFQCNGNESTSVKYVSK